MAKFSPETGREIPGEDIAWRLRLEASGLAESAHDSGCILVVRVDGVIERAKGLVDWLEAVLDGKLADFFAHSLTNDCGIAIVDATVDARC